MHLAETSRQRHILRDLVEAYPGMLVYGRGTGFNAVREQFMRISAEPHSRYVAEAYVRHVEGLLEQMKSAFPGRFDATKKTVADDVAWMKLALLDKYGRREPG